MFTLSALTLLSDSVDASTSCTYPLCRGSETALPSTDLSYHSNDPNGVYFPEHEHSAAQKKSVSSEI